MHEIAKQFDCCYGHRVWSQELDQELALQSQCKCRHLHGHQGTIVVYLQSKQKELPQNGMVIDFNHLNWFKRFVDNVIDHKFLIDINDPLLPTLMSHYPNFDKNKLKKCLNTCEQIVGPKNYYCRPKLEPLQDSPHYIKELYEGLIIVPFLPTSENFSKWILDIVQYKFNEHGLPINVSKVQFYETPKSQSIYVQ